MGTLSRNISKKTPEIVQYWESIVYEGDLGTDWCDAHTRCWRCGYKSSLDRCHIIPKSLGGSDGCDNLVLLCKSCHREAPNCPDSKYMWEWIKQTKVDMYDTFWTIRTFDEFKRINGRSPFSTPEFEDIDIVETIREIKNKMSEVITHYGERGINSSSMVWVIQECEQKYIKKSQ